MSTPVVLQHAVGCAICAGNEEDNRAKCYTEKTNIFCKERPVSQPSESMQNVVVLIARCRRKGNQLQGVQALEGLQSGS